MLPRTNYEMSKQDLKELLGQCKSTPMMKIGGVCSPTPQDNANAAWEKLGNKMGFDYMTVRPAGGQRFFTAVPTETEEMIIERHKREDEEMRLEEIEQLKEEIDKKQHRLDELEE